MKEKLPISLIIIARNEEKNLPRCLNSVVPWVTEIIGVMNDCTDKTKEILEIYGAKIYEHDWIGSTDQKNRALSYATQPWVLSLDADEEISPELKQSIQNFVKDPQMYAGAYFPRLTWFMGRWIKHGDWYPDHMLRVFLRERGKFSGGKDHEKVQVSGAVKKLKGDLLHFSFESINHLISKYPRFGDAFLKYQIEKKKKFSAPLTVLRAYWRFFRCYFIRKGFLDGYPGFFIAFNQFYYTLFRYTRLYEHELKEHGHE